MKDEAKNIQSVQRAIDIINCVANAGRGLAIKEISSRLDLNVNTTRGLVQTLLANGFLAKDVEHSEYTLGYEFLTKSYLLNKYHIKRIRDAAYPDMERISGRFGVASWLQVAFYRNIYTVETVEAPGSHYSYAPKSDSNLPLHATASGKLHLAYMSEPERQKVLGGLSFEPLTEFTITDRDKFTGEIEQVYGQGYAAEIEETDLGIGSIASPFFDADESLGGTLSVVAPAAKLNRIISDVIVELKRTCTRITAAISERPPRACHEHSKGYFCTAIRTAGS